MRYNRDLRCKVFNGNPIFWKLFKLLFLNVFQGVRILMNYRDFKVYWDGHASIRIVDEGFTVAVDPYTKVSPDFEADLILVTHSDLGHFDPGMIDKLSSGKSCAVVPKSLNEEVPCRDVERISPGDTIDIYGIEIEAVKMDNQLRDHSDGIGFRFRMRETDFYVAGDTGLVEDFFDLEGRVDLAFLPVEGEYTMELDDAIRAAARIKPDTVVPYHYGKPFFPANKVDLRSFKAEVEDRNIRCELINSKGSEE